MDFRDKIKSLNEFARKELDARAEHRKAIKRATAMRDLNRRFYKYGAVEVPLPSIAALSFIEDYVGSIDDLDLEKYENVGLFVWVCENQPRIDELVDMDRSEVRKAVAVWMNGINANSDAWMQYIQAVHDVLQIVKKNWITSQISVMAETLKVLDSSITSHK